MIPISQWYLDLGQFSFPTIFVDLDDRETTALLDKNDEDSDAMKNAVARIQQAMKSLPGASFICTDVCAPNDSALFNGGKSTQAIQAWKLLQDSQKVKDALNNKLTRRLVVRPYRRITTVREFRLFIKGRELKAMSQMNLTRHFTRLALREQELWDMALEFSKQIADKLPEKDCAVDIYFTSTDRIMIVDMNQWGEPTDPLLLREWKRDWKQVAGIKLIPPPVKMKGNVSVSF